MKHIKLFLVLLVAGTFLGSCLRDSEVEQTPLGYLIYANAFTESQSISYFFDGRYTSTQPYRGLDGAYVYIGDRSLVITDPITNATLLQKPVRFEDQQVYHSFFYGTREEPKLILTNYEPISELNNQAGIRFFHLANEVGPVDVQFIKEEQVVEDYADREQETDESAETHRIYSAVETGTYTIRVLDEDGDVLAVRENVVLADKTHYTYTLIGTPESETHPLYIGEVK